MKANLFLIGILISALALGSVIALEPVSYTSKGIELNIFPTDMSVYVFYNATMYCDGILEDKDIATYIVPDRNWTEGDKIENYTINTTVKTDAKGKLQPAMIWETPEEGSYDIILDLNNNGVYDVGGMCTEAVDGETTAGFRVITATESAAASTENAEETAVTAPETTAESTVSEPAQENESAVDSTQETTPAVQETAVTTDSSKMDYMPIIIIISAIVIAALIIGITLIRMR